MNIKSNQLSHKLADLDKKAETIDKLAMEIRLRINDLFWDFVKSKKENNGERAMFQAL